MNARIEKYLKAYNLVQLTGWSIALISMYIDTGTSLSTLFIFQILSLAEIFHAWKKWTHSSPLFCFIQIGARIFILFLVFSLSIKLLFEYVRYYDEVIYTMFTAWCIAEIIRYAYYVTQLFKNENKIITWLRYSLFIICYPVGLACEFFVMYTMFKYNDFLAMKMLIVIIAISYFFLFPKLFLHLLNQRNQKLITHNS